MPKTLLLMRHAKSSWKDKSLPDEKRPLKKRGEQAAEAMGEILQENELTPQLILSSSAVRARQTAELVAEHCGYTQPIEFVDEFYMAESPVFFQFLQKLDDVLERVLLIGHNPGLEAFLQNLDGRVEELPTGALAYLNLPIAHWSELDSQTIADLIGFWDPESEHIRESEKKMAGHAKKEHAPAEKHEAAAEQSQLMSEEKLPKEQPAVDLKAENKKEKPDKKAGSKKKEASRTKHHKNHVTKNMSILKKHKNNKKKKK